MLILGIGALCVLILAIILSMVLSDDRKKQRNLMRPVKLKGYWDGKERRNTDRLNVSLKVKYSINGKSARVKAVDISTKGIRLLLDEKIEKGSALSMEIELPGRAGMMKLAGEAMWSNEAVQNKKQNAKRLFGTGIKFINPDQKNEKELFMFLHRLKPRNP